MPKNLLMTFVKNPQLGKAKTRLAKTVGDEKALEVYIQLLKYTRNVAQKVEADRQVHYAEFIGENDLWDNESFRKKVQIEGGLGEKMQHAFYEGFQEGYDKVVIVGSDCPEITPEILESAFEQLNQHDIVFGPADDGGYYLLGMKSLIKPLFQNKQWSTESVLTDSIQDCQNLRLSHALLPQLSDVDYEEDWLRFKNRLEETIK